MTDEAIALFYEGQTAPTITAKQQGEAAQALINAAIEAGIPLYENPALLAELSELGLGQEIPPELYRLIAEILAFAFHIQGKTPPGYEGVLADQ